MARYAKNSHDLFYGQLVTWNGSLYAVWDDLDSGTSVLVPYEVLSCPDADEEKMGQSAVFVPSRQIRVPDKVKATREEMRSLFRLDVMPWDLALKGRFPFGGTTGRYAFSEDDLLTLIDRAEAFQNPILKILWEESFLGKNGRGSRLEEPPADRPGLSIRFLSQHFMFLMALFDRYRPDDEEWGRLRELKDCYLRSKGLPLSETILPDGYGETMIRELEDYAEGHPVTEEIRSWYQTLLDSELESGCPEGIKNYAYAYYGGNRIVPCDWKKAEQALLRLFDPDGVPPDGDPIAANSLGYIYYSERLGAPDHEKAFRCFSFGAENRVIESIYKLSDMYRLGHGTEKDPDKAFEMLSDLYAATDKRRPAEGKLADICLRMGYCYRDGVGVEQDRERAYEFFLKAQKAIEARLRKHPEYGDDTVKKNILKAIESVRTE